MSSGGITNRSGGNTQEIYQTESSIPRQQEQSSSTGKGWLGRAWDWAKEHSKGIGKVLNTGATIGASYFGPTGLAALEAVKTGAGLLKDELKGTKAGKFISGFTNESASNEGMKTYNTLTNKGLDKTGKFLALTNQLKSYNTKAKPLTNNNNVSNTSNGHVPVGYPATSEPLIPAGLVQTNSFKPNTQHQERKNKRRNKNKKKK